jgi:hypothetical protein
MPCSLIVLLLLMCHKSESIAEPKSIPSVSPPAVVAIMTRRSASRVVGVASTTATTLISIRHCLLAALLLTLTSTSNAQTVKINVFTAKSPQVGINGGFNVQTSGALTNLTGLTYRDTYPISDVFSNNQNALALNWNALGVIGESTMLVDEYEVTAENITLLDLESCRQFLDDLDEAATSYYRFDSMLKNTTAFIGVDNDRWLVLLPRGYRVNEQIMGYGTVYANNTAFAMDGVPAMSLIGTRRGSCGIRWVPNGAAVGSAQSILIEFGEPGAVGSTIITPNATGVQTNTTTTTNTTTLPKTNSTNTTVAASTAPSAVGMTCNVGWSSLVGAGVTAWLVLSSSSF